MLEKSNFIFVYFTFIFLFRRVMVKSVKLEWALTELEASLDLIEEGLRAFPDCAKLWMMKGQITEQLGKVDQARDIYAEVT